ncbi:MAG: hypothetical protein WC497_02725 [Patescibacteria group bacterium]
MDITNNPKLIKPMIIAMVLVILVVAILIADIRQAKVGINGEVVKSAQYTQYKKALTCTVINSTSKLTAWLPPTMVFSVENLDTELISMKFPELNGLDIPMHKIYDSAAYVTLEYLEKTGNTQVVNIDKDTGIFVRTITGILSGPNNVRSNYAIAQKGRCE